MHGPVPGAVRRFGRAVVLALACWLASAVQVDIARAQTVTQVTGIRFGVQGSRTRVVIDADRPLSFGTRALDEPWRLVVDLPEVVWNPQPGPLSAVRGIASGQRFGSLGGGAGQLTIDTSRPFRVVTAVLLPPSQHSVRYRLMIDLEPVPPEAFAAETRGPPSAAGTGTAAAAAAIPIPAPAPEPAVRLAALPQPAILERPTATDAPPPIPQIAPRQQRVIVIDAGHGGSDPGAIGVNGSYEKTLTLAMAKELRRALEATGRYRVVLTRDDDVFIPLRERIRLAREASGHLFISLHADALAHGMARGASVYTLSETASDAEAGLLASKENKAEIIVGTDLRNHDPVVTSILIDLAQRDTNNKSIEFADMLSAELAKVTPLLRKHRRFAGFAVLKSPDMPSVLVELGYLSNSEDAANLDDAAFRAKLAQAALSAVDRYFADVKS
ncbi:MAG TPA: N-acetylmuramoyl-L-alanine amidase [Geminicoccaceae bacterium]|nr:N-acetylmuramoyl-L-alanine amidase [Geminicoccus sp.]HMU50250.1 N-acetylmuramoyl-L-alanine amidase [Geminicoccaceae bacterium]